ncbi:TOBE domain-containing protein [Methanotrichaceae archaeon M04Ac]|jgi:molybdopterin-binding protein|uniref:TOBE domain-containing protein n=1 Tax=Candidatus Methanocrinis alkalitolerans TaxID=3033395 RepID=A0ABT5XFJ2_9EURY|nr:TOBE domain-containing protein [Candidatus Methanocrinis alkalitolerans]MCR3883092.1 TOBE domain-containing protein [Methanothrix sp.]MDF0593474.1 TOBE domain-containing protein [Candidatus Methanocrinis alkalitolerans]
MQISARNVLSGRVKAVTLGVVSAEVVVELSGGEEIVSVVTRRSAEELGLSEGKEVSVVVKATSVMIALE